jgi:hypothetical protein
VKPAVASSSGARRVRGGEEVVLKGPTFVLVTPGRHGEDTSRPEHPPELGGRTRRIGEEEQRKGSREHVEPGIGEVQMLGVHDPQVDLGHSRRPQVCPRELDHGRRHVNPREPADPAQCRRDQDRTATAGDVEQVGIARRGSQVDQSLGEVGVVGLADAVVGGRRPIEDTRQPRLVIVHGATLIATRRSLPNHDGARVEACSLGAPCSYRGRMTTTSRKWS